MNEIHADIERKRQLPDPDTCRNPNVRCDDMLYYEKTLKAAVVSNNTMVVVFLLHNPPDGLLDEHSRILMEACEIARELKFRQMRKLLERILEREYRIICVRRSDVELVNPRSSMDVPIDNMIQLSLSRIKETIPVEN